MAFDAMPYHFFEIKMKENKNINKNIHHKSYIKVIIVKFTQDTRDNKRKKGGVNK